MERLTEQQVQAKWAEIAPLIDTLNRRTDTEGDFAVLARSSLAADDAASGPYQVSHAVRSLIMAGVDHLHACKVLVHDAKVIHVAAPSSLSRGALENFATAFWIVHPSNRKERIARTLRWHMNNSRDQERAVSGLGIAESTPADVRVAKILSVARAQGIDEKVVRGGYTSTAAVTYADVNAPKPVGVLFPWRLCSGFAHGRPWAYLGTLEREVRDTDDGSVVLVRLTNDLSRVLYPALASLHLVEDVLREYQRRALPPV